MELLLDRIRSAIAAHRDAPAFLAPEGAIRFADMRALTGAAIRTLHARGLRPGMTVSLTMSQSPLHVMLFLALARMGVASVPVPPIASEADRASTYRRFGVQAAVSDWPDAAASGVPLVLVQGISAGGDESDFDTWSFVPQPGTLLRIALTSGTVERKGIDQDHALFARRLGRRHYGDEHAPRVLPPNLHVTAALQAALHSLCQGGAVVFPRGYDAPSLIDTVKRQSVTRLTMPAVHVEPMLTLTAGQGDTPALPSLRHLRLQGGTPPAHFVARVRRQLSPHVFIPYSTTETGVIAMATGELLERHPGTAGRLVAGSELVVIDEHGNVLPAGVTGEIRVRVDGMPQGYHGGEHAERFRGGWFHPRDRGRITADGLVYIEGRMDAVINVGGRKVSPEHVEERLSAFPGVRECAVFGVLGADGERRVAAAVVRDGPLDWNALASHARAALDVLAPTYYHEVESLPRNMMGKLMRGELAALAAAPLRHPS